jgi:hypothetical protein
VPTREFTSGVAIISGLTEQYEVRGGLWKAGDEARHRPARALSEGRQDLGRLRVMRELGSW